ncbi:MAG: hypothetical protein FE834_06760 [Gammaproteobacteria bacterium]|nr:hypothetical protein [Gammaproteobacteria bacterium]
MVGHIAQTGQIVATDFRTGNTSPAKDEDISQEELIKPFKSKLGVYNRLQELRILTPYLSENQATDEFQSALHSAEKPQASAQVKSSILNTDTLEAQRLVMEGIQKSKVNYLK